MQPFTRACLWAARFVACLPISFSAFAAAPFFPVGSAPPLLLAQAGGTGTPGQLVVDEEAAERALERALVSTGVLLLPPGKAELEPALSYLRAEQDAPVLVDVGGQPLVARQTVGTDIFEASLLLRLGLPASTQLELDLPYQYVNEERVTEFEFQTAGAGAANQDGIGDVRIGLAKALLTESASRPNLVARVTWDTDTGDTDGSQVSLRGAGFNEIEVSLSATKRQDPLVFVGEVFYQTTLDDRDQIEPGDQFGLSVGTLLAASPHTSLRVALDQVYAGDVQVNGVSIDGSDAVVASLLVGASSIIGKGKFFDFSIQTGLTEAAPAYGFRASLTKRFDVRKHR
jgi:hypothetical protein